MVAVNETQAPETRIPIGEAVRLSRKSRKSLMTWIERGRIRGYRVGARIVVVREDVERFLLGEPIAVRC